MCEECGCKFLREVEPGGVVELALEIPGATLVAVGICGAVEKSMPKGLAVKDWEKRELPKDPQ